MKARPVTDHEEDLIRERYYFDGPHLRYRVPVGKFKCDDIAGTETDRGYSFVSVLGKKFAVHRVVFFLHNSWWPEIVDHIDFNKRNNHPNNLRAATKAQNRFHREGGSGKGYRKLRNGRYEVYGTELNSFKYLGTVDTENEAAELRRQYVESVYGDFAKECKTEFLTRGD